MPCCLCASPSAVLAAFTAERKVGRSSTASAFRLAAPAAHRPVVTNTHTSFSWFEYSFHKPSYMHISRAGSEWRLAKFVVCGYGDWPNLWCVGVSQAYSLTSRLFIAFLWA
jgi:hypothetical protein